MNTMMGKMRYEMSCIFCHGGRGEGDGPAAFWIGPYSSPRPRDFTTGTFKFRSTPSGELPTDEDLFRTITEGIPGYMPSFRSLSERARWQLVHSIKVFLGEYLEEAPSSDAIPLPPKVPESQELIARGRDLYRMLKCWQCHGDSGRGDGPSAGELTDEWGQRIEATDLTRPSGFKAGSRPEDLVRMLLTGLNGTPMPSFADVLPDEQAAWALAYYLLSLSRE